MRRKTPQYIKNTNYLSTQEKVHKDKIHISLAVFSFFCVWKNYTVYFFFVDFFCLDSFFVDFLSWSDFCFFL